MLPGVENKEQPQGAHYECEMVPMDGPDGVTRHIPVYRCYGADGQPTLITATEFHGAVERGEQNITYR